MTTKKKWLVEGRRVKSKVDKDLFLVLENGNLEKMIAKKGKGEKGFPVES